LDDCTRTAFRFFFFSFLVFLKIVVFIFILFYFHWMTIKAIEDITPERQKKQKKHYKMDGLILILFFVFLRLDTTLYQTLYTMRVIFSDRIILYTTETMSNHVVVVQNNKRIVSRTGSILYIIPVIGISKRQVETLYLTHHTSSLVCAVYTMALFFCFVSCCLIAPKASSRLSLVADGNSLNVIDPMASI
jgi:hypothetical protein